MNGWIKLHRKLIDWEWYTNPNVFRLFIHCLLKANHKDKKWQGIIIKSGQFATGLNSLKKELKISTQSIRTSLDKLKSTHEITIKSTNKFSIISINNWEDYQQLTSKLTNNQQTTNKQLTTNNKCNELKNVNKDIHKEVDYLLNEEALKKDFLDKRFKGINVNFTDVKRKAEEIYNWAISSKKNRRDDYRAVLRNALVRDFSYTIKS